MFHMHTRFLFALGVVLAGSTNLPAQEDHKDLLAHASAKVLDTLSRIPRYMCTQTIDRSRYQPKDSHRAEGCGGDGSRRDTTLVTFDRLRLDVAMSERGEIYSWVGESRFSDADLVDIVREGAIATGSFANFLGAIFHDNNATFTYKGDYGRTLVEFAYKVPQEKSGFHYGEKPNRVVTGFEGTFLVDPKTSELARLVVRTDPLPPETRACYTTTTLSYARVRLKKGQPDLLLPTETRMRIFHPDGSESENRTVFSGCHEFLGESSIRFDGPEGDPGGQPSQTPPKSAALVGAASAAPIEFPPGLSFHVELLDDIRLSVAAAGDFLRAKLVTPIQDGTEVLAPARSAVTARIVRVRQFHGANFDVSLMIKLETIEINGVARRLAAIPESPRAFYSKGRLIEPKQLGSFDALENRAATFTFRYPLQRDNLPGHLVSKWVTSRPGAVDDKVSPR
jgi:hypothetical protein